MEREAPPYMKLQEPYHVGKDEVPSVELGLGGSSEVLSKVPTLEGDEPFLFLSKGQQWGAGIPSRILKMGMKSHFLDLVTGSLNSEGDFYA